MQENTAEGQHQAAAIAQNTADIAKLTKQQELAKMREAKLAEEIARCREVIAALSAQCDHLEQNSKTVSLADVEGTTRNFQVLCIGLECQSMQLQRAVDPAIWEDYAGARGTSSIERLLAPSFAAAAPPPPVVGMRSSTPRATDGALGDECADDDGDGDTASTSSDATTASRGGGDAARNSSRSGNLAGAGADEVSTEVPVTVILGSPTVPPPLREYQQYILDELLQWYAAPPQNPVKPDVAAVVLPTGAGKTSIAFELLLHAARQQGRRAAVFLAPTVALVEQQARRFVLRRDVIDSDVAVQSVAGGAARVLCGGHRSGGLQVVFATPQSYNQWDQRRALEPVLVLILDESHHAKLSVRTNHPYQLALDGSGPGAKVVGLSATPEAFLERDPRIVTVAAGERGLARNQVEEVQIDIVEFFPAEGRLLCDHLLELEAIRKGAQRIDDVDRLRLAVAAQRLYRNIGWGAVAADLDSKGADSSALLLSSKPIRRSPVVDAVIAALGDAMGRATDRQPQVIVYCDHIESAKLLTRMLTGLRGPTSPPELAWVRPALITGKQPKTEMKQVLDDFHATNVTVLVATSCVREGIDVPGCNLVIAVEPPRSKLDDTQLKGRARSLHSKYVVITAGSDEQNAYACVTAEAPPVAPAENPDAAAQDCLDRDVPARMERAPGPRQFQPARPTSEPRGAATAPDAKLRAAGTAYPGPIGRAAGTRPSEQPAASGPISGQSILEQDLEHLLTPGERQVSAPGANLSLLERILRALASGGRPMTALELSKAVGLTTAKDANPVIYALQQSGKVETLSKSGSKPCWSLV